MHNDGSFSSKRAFIIASIGSAVGMGNIWMFPYRVAECGGAAFLIPYFIFVILFGIVGLSGEFAIGRMTGKGPVEAFSEAFSKKGLKGGKLFGFLPIFAIFGIGVGYSVVMGWALRTFTGFANGELMTGDVGAYFGQITGDFGSLFWHLAMVIVTLVILGAGVQKGIEKVSKVIMPLFFLLFLGLAVTVFFIPGAREGYKYLLVPDWSALLSVKTWVMAMGQAFFSLSIGGSGMIVYGRYLSKKEDVVNTAKYVALFDTLAAVLAGFVVIPVVFAYGLDLNAGPPLMFITLPALFQQMPMGRLFAIIFFASVLIAGVTSLMNIFESCICTIREKFKLSRVKAVVLFGLLVFSVGIFIENGDVVGSWMDFFSIYLVPLGGLLAGICGYWIFGVDKIKEELMISRTKPIPKYFDFFAKYVYIILGIAVLVLGVLYGGIG